MIRAIIFDLDQTLLDREATFANYLRRQHRDFDLNSRGVSESEYLTFILGIDDHGYARKAIVFDRVGRELLGGSVSGESLLRHYLEGYGQEPVLYEGVEETLAALGEACQLGLITNGRVQSQSAKLEASGIASHFDAIQISEAAGVKKPDPLIFESCIRSLNRKASECVYVGDHPANDVEGAKACGLKAVWLRKSYYDPPANADGIIDAIPEIAELWPRL